VLCVAAGRIFLLLVTISKTVTVQGGYSTAFTEPPDPDANPTTLDAGKQGRVIYVISGNRAANNCGGICFSVSHNAVLSGNAVVSNTRGPGWDGYGAGVYLSNGKNTTLVGNLISNNTARNTGNPGTILGGGLYIGSGSNVASTCRWCCASASRGITQRRLSSPLPHGSAEGDGQPAITTSTSQPGTSLTVTAGCDGCTIADGRANVVRQGTLLPGAYRAPQACRQACMCPRDSAAMMQHCSKLYSLAPMISRSSGPA